MKKLAYNQGFTLVETLIAILILSMTIGALMTLAANGFFSVRYARNDIVASSLLQESLEAVRNNRDTWIQQGKTWEDWKINFGAPEKIFCFDDRGCIVDVYPLDPSEDTAISIRACSTSCPALNYFTTNNLYGYYPSMLHPSSDTTDVITTTFVRTITMKESEDGNQVIVSARMDWKNGTASKYTTQSIILTNLFNE